MFSFCFLLVFVTWCSCTVAGNEGINAPPPAGRWVTAPELRVSRLLGPLWQTSLHCFFFYSERNMDDPYGAGSSLLGALVNASRRESAESGESKLYLLLLEILVVLMCFVTVTGTSQS